MTVAEAKRLGRKKLEQKSHSPALDTDCFLHDILAWDKTRLLFDAEQNLSTEMEKDFLSRIEKRLTGLPVAYINGHTEFYGFDFFWLWVYLNIIYIILIVIIVIV